MTTAPDEQSLSRLHIVVLARLSVDKPPSEAKLATDIAKLASPAPDGAPALAAIAEVLPALRRSGLVNGRQLTENGKRALRKAFELEHTPSWTEVRTMHLAALGLGMQPGAGPAAAALDSSQSLLTHLVGSQLGLAKASTMNELCDGVIMQMLAIPPGPLTLTRVRAYALARKGGVPVAADSTGSPVQVATDIVRPMLSPEAPKKPAIVQALARRWLYDVTTLASPVAVPGPRATPVQAALPLSTPPATKSPPPTAPKPLVAVSADTLLSLVRETIPRIGSDGRFGSEKVFVSAIWHRLEHDSRLPDLSLDRFKRWLVTANREQLLDLARADLVGAMDPKQVKESEIEDLGATFHFVVDRRANGASQGHHAR